MDFINKSIKLTLIFCIKIYQFLLSPFIAKNACRFYPTCSQYMIDSLKERGIVKGLYLGIWRLLRCNPWSRGGNDPIKKC